MLAAATLLFLIAFPIVNCRRLNVFSIEELGEHFSAKDYDQGRRDKEMNQAINAHSKGDRGIITRREPCYSEDKICKILTKLVRKLSRKKSKTFCGNISDNACSCGNPKSEQRCDTCVPNYASIESVSKK